MSARSNARLSMRCWCACGSRVREIDITGGAYVCVRVAYINVNTTVALQLKAPLLLECCCHCYCR